MKSSSGAICRNASPDKPFTLICNSALKDYSLSLDAVGFLVRFLSMPRDWSASLAWARKTFRIGEQKAERIIAELIERGYVRRAERERRTNGTLGPVLYEFTDLPFVFADNSHAVKTAPVVVDHAVKNHPVGSHAVGNHPYTKEKEEKEESLQIKPLPLSKGEGALSENFLAFWKAYPGREDGTAGSQRKAWEAWKAEGCEEEGEKVLACGRRYAASLEKPNAPKVKHAHRWLKDRRWDGSERERPVREPAKALPVAEDVSPEKRADVGKGLSELRDQLKAKGKSRGKPDIPQEDRSAMAKDLQDRKQAGLAELVAPVKDHAKLLTALEEAEHQKQLAIRFAGLA